MPNGTTKDLYIGVDVGTTSVKACSFTASGKMVTETIEAYPLEHPEPGAATQVPATIMASCARALKATVAATPDRIAAVGLSCPMHSVVLYRDNEGFDDTIFTWADNRGQVNMADFTAEERRELHRLTGTPVHPMSPLVKVRWLTEHRAERMRWATHIYGLKELLTNSWATETLIDEQLASATGLCETTTARWSPRAVTTALHLPAATPLNRVAFKFAPIRPATHQLTWQEAVAEELGVVGIPLFLGGSDGCLANLGSGITQPGQVAVTIGTSAAVRATHGRATIDPNLGLFNYRMNAGRFAIGGASNNGGKVIEYWHQLLRADYPKIGDFIDAAFTVDPQNCPTLQPYLYGERAPLWDAAATGTLSNLAGHHGPEHIARAVLEGVTNNVVHILKNLEQAVGPTQIVEASGGFTRSREWVELLAERSGRRVDIADTPQASAYGAALVAQLGLEAINT